MIKIIEKGDINNAPTYTRTCPECKTKFEYKYEDTQLNNNTGGYIQITCPLCGYPVAHITGGSSEVNNPPLDDSVQTV